uniref:Uncharacterized protein n=1 Tax=Panagrolaimus sp. PS1159 TaxID=55785 RepID=A0AC35FLW6_9BILA
MKVKIYPKRMSLRSIKFAQMDEAATLAQRATGLLITVSFVILPIFWSNMIKTMGNNDASTPSSSCNFDPWSEFNRI